MRSIAGPRCGHPSEVFPDDGRETVEAELDFVVARAGPDILEWVLISLRENVASPIDVLSLARHLNRINRICPRPTPV
jgi:hypothetical protein